MLEPTFSASKAALEDGLPQFVNSPEEASALNCYKCGAPALRGAPMCLHCGSGLESELLTDKEKLRQSADELDWEKDCYNEEIPKLIDTMIAISKKRNKDVFLMIRKYPLLVKLDDPDVKTVVRRFGLVKKLIGRDQLGDSWYQALKRFNDLQKTLSGFSSEIRKAMAASFIARSKDKKMDGSPETFFSKIDFVSAEEIMNNYVGEDDDQLNRFIDLVDKEIQKVISHQTK